jgi:hypothetical protein
LGALPVVIRLLVCWGGTGLIDSAGMETPGGGIRIVASAGIIFTLDFINTNEFIFAGISEGDNC